MTPVQAFVTQLSRRESLPSSRAAVLPVTPQANATDPHHLNELIGGAGNDWAKFTSDWASTALKTDMRDIRREVSIAAAGEVATNLRSPPMVPHPAAVPAGHNRRSSTVHADVPAITHVT
jgi:hypothetical protein